MDWNTLKDRMYLEPFLAVIFDNGDGQFKEEHKNLIGRTIYVQDYRKGTIYAEYLTGFYHVQNCEHNDAIPEIKTHDGYQRNSMCFEQKYLQPISSITEAKKSIVSKILRKD